MTLEQLPRESGYYVERGITNPLGHHSNLIEGQVMQVTSDEQDKDDALSETVRTQDQTPLESTTA